jgi:hypothetical protein
MNRSEPERLHLEIPNAWSQIQRIAARFISERRHFGVALDGSDRRAGQKLIRGADRAALLDPRQQRQPDNKERQIASHGWKPSRRIFPLGVDDVAGKC